jgi:hypothetical protein
MRSEGQKANKGRESGGGFFKGCPADLGSWCGTTQILSKNLVDPRQTEVLQPGSVLDLSVRK